MRIFLYKELLKWKKHTFFRWILLFTPLKLYFCNEERDSVSESLWGYFLLPQFLSKTGLQA